MNTEKTSASVRRSERLAILSSCCGFPAEVALTDSAVVLLFAVRLGAGEMLTLLTTSFLPLLNGVCMLPAACLVMRRGHRAVMLRMLGLSTFMYFLAASSPWFGSASLAVMLIAIIMFGIGISGFVAGWYPMLDTFLVGEQRTRFFGRMRFCHQLSSVAFMLAAGAFLGGQPPVWKLQTVLFAAALLFCGRVVCIAGIPSFPHGTAERVGGCDGLRRAIGNRSLTGFSLYLFLINISTFGTVPLTMLYLKKQLHAHDCTVVFISAAALVGMLLGYSCAGKIARCLGSSGRAFALFHLLFFLLSAMLIFLHDGGVFHWCYAGAVLLPFSFSLGAASILASSCMMELAAPGNKVMAMAFSGTFSYAATGLARVFPSLLLGSGIIAPQWNFYGLILNRYQSLYLLFSCAVLLSAVFLFLVPSLFPDDQTQA